MTALIQPGAEVHPYLAPDGTTQVRCPSCGHYIPNVAPDALTITEQRPTASMIACRCPLGEGTNVIGQRVQCPCHAVFRLRSAGMQRYEVVEGWQEEAQVEPVLAIEINGIVTGDGMFRVEKEVTLDENTLLIEGESSVVTLDDPTPVKKAPVKRKRTKKPAARPR